MLDVRIRLRESLCHLRPGALEEEYRTVRGLRKRARQNELPGFGSPPGEAQMGVTERRAALQVILRQIIEQ